MLYKGIWSKSLEIMAIKIIFWSIIGCGNFRLQVLVWYNPFLSLHSVLMDLKGQIVFLTACYNIYNQVYLFHFSFLDLLFLLFLPSTPATS